MPAASITLSPVWAFPWQGSLEQSSGCRMPLAESDAGSRSVLWGYPHLFDLVHRLTGSDFESSYAKAAPEMRIELEVEDLLLAIGRTTDGSRFPFGPSWSRGKNACRSLVPAGKCFQNGWWRLWRSAVIAGAHGWLFRSERLPQRGPNDRYTAHDTYCDERIRILDEFADW